MNSTGFFRTAFDRIAAIRQREANRYVSSVLLALDDETLKAHGYNREDLRCKAGPAYP